MRFQRLVAYWLNARAGAIVPDVTAIDPLRFHHLLEQVWLCGVGENPREFRYRLVGDHVRAAYAGPLIGRTLRELTAPDAVARVLGYFDTVVDRPAVVHVVGRISAAERSSEARRVGKECARTRRSRWRA